LNQDGIVIARRQADDICLNYGQRLFKDRFELTGSLKFAHADYKFTPGGVVGNAAQMGPTQPVFDTASSTGYYEWPGGIQSPDNPIAILALGTDRGDQRPEHRERARPVQCPILEGLRLNVNLGYDQSRADRESFSPSVMHSEQKSGYSASSHAATTSRRPGTGDLPHYTAPTGVVPGNVDVTAGYSYQKSTGSTRSSTSGA